jgi:hypothetical protein
MLPKINSNVSTTAYNIEKTSKTLVVEDHLKKMLGKTSNVDYKPWKNPLAPKYPPTPFGNFPRENLPTRSFSVKKLTPNYEESAAASTAHKGEEKNNKMQAFI